MYDEQKGREVASVWTPWDFADHKDEIAPGIVFYSTPGHGGFWLSDERMAQVAPELREATFVGRQPGWERGRWYEEDCDAAIVIVTFPDYFTAQQVSSAWASLKHWHEGPVEALRRRGCADAHLTAVA